MKILDLLWSKVGGFDLVDVVDAKEIIAHQHDQVVVEKGTRMPDHLAKDGSEHV